MLSACTEQPAPSPASNATESGPQPQQPADPVHDPAERSIVVEKLAYAEVDRQLVKGHFAFPEDMVEPLPAIVLIHEWWGLNDAMQSLADRLAAEGFIVLAVDLFNGETASHAADARNLMLQVVQNPRFAEQNILQACDWLRVTTGAPSIATVGYGFGGGWSLHAAMTMPGKLNAAVMYYGQVSNNEQVLSEMQVPLLGFFGSDDTAVPAESVGAFEALLEKLGKTYDIEIFADAKGGFADPDSRNFNAELAASSWDQMLKFLNLYLYESSVE